MFPAMYESAQARLGNVKPVLFYSTSTTTYMCFASCRLKMLLHSSFAINHRLKYRCGIEYHTQTLHKCAISVWNEICVFPMRNAGSFNGEWCIFVSISIINLSNESIILIYYWWQTSARLYSRLESNLINAVITVDSQ